MEVSAPGVQRGGLLGCPGWTPVRVWSRRRERPPSLDSFQPIKKKKKK